MTALLQVLGLGRGDVVALCGGGGKSTLARAVVGAARQAHWRVVLTSTTHCGLVPDWPVELADSGLSAVDRALDRDGLVQVVSEVTPGGRARGLPAERAGAFARIADLVVVEADGARGRAVKAPGPHEPALPRPCSVVIAVCGLSALGAPLDERNVHRLERVLSLCGRHGKATVDVDVLAAAFGPGGYGSIGAADRRTLFLATTEPHQGAVEQLAGRLAAHFERVVAGDPRRGELLRPAVSSVP